MQEFWTPEKIEILKGQWALGTSVRVVAAMLGASRGAVIGKARRLGLPLHAASPPHPEVPRKRAKKQPKAKPRAARRRPAGACRPQGASRAPVSTRHMSFAGLLPHHCRYPVTPEPPFLFCGERRQEKSAYCSGHHALCHVVSRCDETRRHARPRSRFDFFSGGARAA